MNGGPMTKFEVTIIVTAYDSPGEVMDAWNYYDLDGEITSIEKIEAEGDDDV
jgi:hypothetical protein